MACRIRTQQIDGVDAAVAVVCDRADDKVSVPSTPSDAVLVDAMVLAEFLPTIDPAIETLVFLTADDAAQIDGTAAVRIVRLVNELRNAPDHVAAIRRVPAVNAVKRVSDGLVVEAVDRETLNLLRPPEVVDRHTLETKLERLGPEPADEPVNPTILAAADGGKVLVVEGL